jgi:hypothetical protein
MLDMFIALGWHISTTSTPPSKTTWANVQQPLLHVKDVLELGQKPLVDIGHLPDLVDRITATERSGDGKDTLVGGVHELLVDILYKVVL